MTEHDDSRSVREEKLRQLVGLGLPYAPNRYPATRPSTGVIQDYEALEGAHVRVAGRIMRVRLMGKAAFAHIQDRAGQIQLYFKLDVMGPEKWEYFKLLDVGDIIGAEGNVFKTRTGEVSIGVEDVVLLAKSYLPLPDKFHGLANVETRYRQRYLDLISNEEARRTFEIRSRALQSIREYLNRLEFVEVETPVLQSLYGGAAANPFTTHYASLDSDVYLRIATELYLKRLIIGGMERVYEIGKDFRNEGFSWKHSPEFTMLELYQAYADYEDIMTLTENLVSAVALQICETATVSFNGHEINLAPPWQRVTILDAVRQYAGIDLDTSRTVDELRAAAVERGLEVAPGAPRGQVIEEIVSELVEPNLVQPTFLIDYPLDFPGSLLAKRKAGQPDIAERFEIYLGGFELGNAFTELNEPADQLTRMEDLAKETGAAVDLDFVRALEQGMPPTGGVGIGIDRLVMVLAGVHSIRETILFPLLRRREEAHA